MSRANLAGAGIEGYAGILWRGNEALVVALAVASLLCVLAFAAMRKRRASYRRGRFLTANEKSFLIALDEAVGEEFRVFAQVRLADLVDVDTGASRENRRLAMSKVFGKSIDFVICDPRTLEPIAAIELDDRTHALKGRRARDVFVNNVFAEIGLPLLRVRARREYSAGMLRSTLIEAGLRGNSREAPAKLERT